MCFRPADTTAGTAECPNCGKKIQAMGGIPLKKCPFCGADFSAIVAPAVGGAGLQSAPHAPAAPKPAGAPPAPLSIPKSS